MKLLLLFGDSAVGKMTVGQELTKITQLSLFHNHMTIEPVLEVFHDYNWPAINGLREVFFEEFAQTDNYGMIFTYMWAFDSPYDWQYVRRIREPFERQSADIYYTELIAPLEVRLQRNITDNRLLHKPSKRNLARSESFLLENVDTHRFISEDGELAFDNYIKIDNSNIPANECARMIKDRFRL